MTDRSRSDEAGRVTPRRKNLQEIAPLLFNAAGAPSTAG
jgi:hypothetical protein